jgi:hypothetical protein
MDSSTATRIRPCFTEEDDGLASLAEPAGFSGNPNHHHHPPFFFSRPLYFNTLSHRKNSLRNLSSSSSPRSGSKYYFEEVVHQQPHFLEACALCKKPLGDNKDIFMYRFVLILLPLVLIWKTQIQICLLIEFKEQK